MSEYLPCDLCDKFPCELMRMDGMTILEALKVCCDFKLLVCADMSTLSTDTE